MVGILGAVGDFMLFFHIFVLICNFIYLLGTLYFCNVPQVIFEVIIGVILRLTDPRLGSVIAKKQGAIANYG